LAIQAHPSGAYLSLTQEGLISSRNAPKDWNRPFDDPIPLPKGRQLVTLRDAALYITKPPGVSRSEHSLSYPNRQAVARDCIIQRIHRFRRRNCSVDVSDAFRWPGGSHLFLEVTIDRRGRPAEVGELLTVLQKLQWAAAIAEAMAHYCVDERDGEIDPDNNLKLWIQSLPNVVRAPVPDDGSASEFDAYFDVNAILAKLSGIAGSVSEPKRSSVEFRLRIELVELFHENPTRGRFVVGGCLLSLGFFAAMHEGVQFYQESHVHDCRAQIIAMSQEQLKTLMSQVRFEGKVDAHLKTAIEESVKGSAAAVAACTREYGDIKIELPLAMGTFSISRSSSRAASSVAEESPGGKSKESSTPANTRDEPVRLKNLRISDLPEHR
jgi:hypothetical protein